MTRFRTIAALIAGICYLSAASRSSAADVSGCSEDDLRSLLALGDLITFSQDCTNLTVTSPLEVSSDTTIDAQGHFVSLSGGGLVSIFVVNPNANFTARGLTLTGGKNTNGGAVYVRGGAVATFSNCTFFANIAAGSNGLTGITGSSNDSGNGGDGGTGTSGIPGFGGAIFNAGTVSVLYCTLSNNMATGGNGGNGGNGGDGGNGAWNAGNGGKGADGALGIGGAIYNQGQLTLINSTISGTTNLGGNGGSGGAGGSGVFPGRTGAGAPGGGAYGGAVYNNGIMDVSGCTLSGNTARAGTSAPGGEYQNGNGTTGATGPSAAGGALCNGSTATASITNCTLVANTAIGGAGGTGGSGDANAGNGGNGGNGLGGGVYNSGTLTVLNCTIARCTAVPGTNGVAGTGASPGDDGQPGLGLGDDIDGGAGTFILKNSIISGSLVGNNGYGLVTDAGHNLSSDSSLTFGPTSFRNTNPRLNALGNNGGPTATLALAANSPARDQVPPPFPPTDQRGLARGEGGINADIGAYEFVAGPHITIQPTNATVALGSNVVFSVTAMGSPTLTYQWQHDGTNIAGAIFRTYTVTNASSPSAGDYAVTITNPYGSVTSDTVTLTVLSAPTILVNPVSQTVTQGQAVTFSVQASGNALSYQWNFQSAPIPGANGTNYSIPSAQPTNSGTYTVTVSNRLGSITSPAVTLSVVTQPQLLVQPSSGSNSVTFAFQTQTNTSYVLQYKNTLSDTNWLPLATNNGTGSWITNSVPPTNSPSRFYRLQLR